MYMAVRYWGKRSRKDNGHVVMWESHLCRGRASTCPATFPPKLRPHVRRSVPNPVAVGARNEVRELTSQLRGDHESGVRAAHQTSLRTLRKWRASCATSRRPVHWQRAQLGHVKSRDDSFEAQADQPRTCQLTSTPLCSPCVTCDTFWHEGAGELTENHDSNDQARG